jgi:hypothetical protein
MNGPPLEYAPPSRRRPTRRQVWRAIVAALASPLVLFVVVDLGCGGEHRSVLWPSIDTAYASGYSENAFRTLRVGMTRQQVDRIMCTPLYAAPAGGSLDSGFLRYGYTSDGACLWGDFAWLDRSVEFQDGVVTKVNSQVYYD